MTEEAIMEHGNESAGAGATDLVEETERSRGKKREGDRDVLQMSSREGDRDVLQIEGALRTGEPDVRHLVERLGDGDRDLIMVLARLRADAVFEQTLLALARLLAEKPFVVGALGRLAAPRASFKKLLDSILESEDRS